jgi:hypothetical protein
VGLLSKAVNKSITSRVAAPTQGITALDQEAIFAIVREVAATYVPKRMPSPEKKLSGDRRFFVDKTQTPNALLIVCARPLLVDFDKHGDLKSASWIAQVSVGEGDAQGRRPVQFQFIQGKTKDGALEEKRLYQQYQERFIETLQQRDPTLVLGERQKASLNYNRRR